MLLLAAHCPPNWEPSYFEIDKLNGNAESQIGGGNFDLIAISSFTAQILDAYDLADRLRLTGSKVVLDGRSNYTGTTMNELFVSGTKH